MNMTLDQVLDKIVDAGSISASVSRVAHGNADSAGDYRIVRIKVGQEEIRFRQKRPHGWIDEPTELANRLSDLHHALEGDAVHAVDWGMARALEDALGAGHYIPSQIETAKQLLVKHGCSLPW